MKPSKIAWAITSYVQITTVEKGTIPSASAYNLEIVERTLSIRIRSR